MPQRDGTLWAATIGGPARLVGGRFVAVSLPDGIRLQRITGMTTDAEGALWITDNDDGLFRLAHDTLSLVDAGLQRSASVFTDRTSRVWIGQRNGGLTVYDKGRLASYSAAGGPDGTVTAVYEDSHGKVWIGTTTGLGRFENERFVREDIEDLAIGGTGYCGGRPRSTLDRHSRWNPSRKSHRADHAEYGFIQAA